MSDLSGASLPDFRCENQPTIQTKQNCYHRIILGLLPYLAYIGNLLRCITCFYCRFQVCLANLALVR